MRPTDDIAAWTFLDETTLNTVFDSVTDFIDDPDVLQTALSCSVDDQGFSSITLCTRNMEIFNLFRAGIRDYMGIPNFTLDTFSRKEFVQKKSATIYVPRRFARFGPRRLFRTLVHVYPGLAARYELFHKHEFTENLPGKPNRIGDFILVVGGEAFLKKLALYPESYVFHINPYWRFTIRGTDRQLAIPISDEDIEHAAHSLEFSRELSHKISPTEPAAIAAAASTASK